MNAPKTLTEAREQLEAAGSMIKSLTAKVAAYESLESLSAAGIVRVDEGESIRFTVPRLAEYESKIEELTGKVATLEADNKTLSEKSVEAIENARLLKIELNTAVASAKTVETRAREMTASLGGPPLAVDSTDGAELTVEVLRTQLIAEKDPNAQYVLYKKIKAQEAKSKLNGTRH